MRTRKPQCESIQSSLATPYEQQGVALFLKSFVWIPPNTIYCKGFLAGLSPLLGTAKSNSLLSSTVDAVGLCFLATTTDNPLIAARAARTYVRSLNHLQKALYHPVDCGSHGTIISVYLMGLYEVRAPQRNTDLTSG